jgi:2-C-methyl-D-erythritol 4-phosphate cytidylyltransferase
MKKFALIVAGGSGKRMESDIPKQFITIEDKPLLMHTIRAFLSTDPNFEIIVVLPENQIENWKSICVKLKFSQKQTLVPGGSTRFHSVKNGLKKITEEGIVFIHDGVRPLVSAKTINNCYEMALNKGNALPVIAPSESVRRIVNDKNKAVDRSNYVLVQTPQTFKVSLIKKAFEQDYNQKFTDDASVLENYGKEIQLVEGNRENIKITYPEDLDLANIYLEKNSPAQ